MQIQFGANNRLVCFYSNLPPTKAVDGMENCMFPKKARCRRKIEQFQEQAPSLDEIWSLIQKSPNKTDTLKEVESRTVTLLGLWGAYRYRHGPRNERFLTQLFSHKHVANAFFEIVSVTKRTGRLHSILKHEDAINALYDFMKCSIFSAKEPARIVTVSKALLMVAGFSVGLDSSVLEKIKLANPYALACPGVWPFCLYFETLEFLADQQEIWESKYGPMVNLCPGVPIGQVMDRVLWESG